MADNPWIPNSMRAKRQSGFVISYRLDVTESHLLRVCIKVKLLLSDLVHVPDLAGPFVAHHARSYRGPRTADLAKEFTV